MGNTAMCKVCGSDKGLRTAGSLSNLDQNAWPDFYCVEHFPVQPPLMLVRVHSGRCRGHFQSTGTLLKCPFWGIFTDEKVLSSFFKAETLKHLDVVVSSHF